MRFERAEKFLLLLLGVMAALGICIAVIKHIAIQYSDYLIYLCLASMFLMIGQFYRSYRNHQPIACASTAIAIFVLSGQIMRSFNYLLLPYQFASIDDALAGFDSLFGFVWSDFAVWMAGYPGMSGFLRTVYTSSYVQIVLLIFLLGLAGRSVAILKFSLANIIGGLITIQIWYLFPSSTPVAFQTMPSETASILDLFLTAEYGQGLVRLGQRDLSLLVPSELGGIVGFPSFHTVMAMVVVYFSRSIPFGIVPFAIWNAFMIPAILLHGAHNLADVFGGMVVATLGIWMANKITDHRKASERSPQITTRKDAIGVGAA